MLEQLSRVHMLACIRSLRDNVVDSYGLPPAIIHQDSLDTLSDEKITELFWDTLDDHIARKASGGVK